MTRFIFDLDGTVTSVETLPVIAKAFGVQEEIEQLTRETIAGNIPFIESFIHRVHVLGQLPVSEINTLLETVPLYPMVHAFITAHLDQCILATGNLRCWVEKLVKKVGCQAMTSECVVKDNTIHKLTQIFKKEELVSKYKNQGDRVVFIGEGNNDMEAMRLADVAIAAGLTHPPARSVLTVTDYLVHSEEALCRQLNQLC
jgi:HAD superfamily phosphoserine phosphatase-like hydrolase